MPDDKTMSITNSTQAKDAGVTVHGDPDMWFCACKAFNEAEGWMKSTKVLEIDAGCLVQVTTQQRNPGGGYSLAEALTFVPGAKKAMFEYVVPEPESTDVPDTNKDKDADSVSVQEETSSKKKVDKHDTRQGDAPQAH